MAISDHRKDAKRQRDRLMRIEDERRRQEVFQAERDAYLAFRALTETNKEYLDWESAFLYSRYPGRSVKLCGRSYPAMTQVPVSRSTEWRSGQVLINFSDLTMLENMEIHSEQYDSKTNLFIRCAHNDGKGEIRYPDRVGYEAIEWSFDGSRPLLTVGLSRYRDTAAGGYRLQAELIDRWENGAKTPLRDALSDFGNAPPITRPDQKFHATLGVQALVVIVGDEDAEVVMMRRSATHATRAGWLQFPPSGAMEVFGSTTDENFSNLRKESDPAASLRREFVEELFGVDELQSGIDGIYENLAVSKHGELLGTAFREKRAVVRFLGIAWDMATLRPELSFLIIARNVPWELKAGSETKELFRAPFAEVSRRIRSSDSRLNSTSAALLRLALDSGALYEDGILRREDAERYFGEGAE